MPSSWSSVYLGAPNVYTVIGRHWWHLSNQQDKDPLILKQLESEECSMHLYNMLHLSINPVWLELHDLYLVKKKANRGLRLLKASPRVISMEPPSWGWKRQHIPREAFGDSPSLKAHPFQFPRTDPCSPIQVLPLTVAHLYHHFLSKMPLLWRPPS